MLSLLSFLNGFGSRLFGWNDKRTVLEWILPIKNLEQKTVGNYVVGSRGVAYEGLFLYFDCLKLNLLDGWYHFETLIGKVEIFPPLNRLALSQPSHLLSAVLRGLWIAEKFYLRETKAFRLPFLFLCHWNIKTKSRDHCSSLFCCFPFFCFICLFVHSVFLPIFMLIFVAIILKYWNLLQICWNILRIYCEYCKYWRKKICKYWRLLLKPVANNQ